MKKPIEPFNLVGENSLIFSRQQAEKILRDNSYYIFVAAFIMFTVDLFLILKPVDIGISKTIILICGIFYFVLGVSIKYLKSRIASILALASFTLDLFFKIMEQRTNNGWWFFTLIFIAASYRAVKASFYYHKCKVKQSQAL